MTFGTVCIGFYAVTQIFFGTVCIGFYAVTHIIFGTVFRGFYAVTQIIFGTVYIGFYAVTQIVLGQCVKVNRHGNWRSECLDGAGRPEDSGDQNRDRRRGADAGPQLPHQVWLHPAQGSLRGL